MWILPRTSYRKKAFSLLELLITIAIITVLLVLGISRLMKTREQSANVRCIQNLRQIASALVRSAGENNGTLKFQRYSLHASPTTLRWSDFLIQGGYLQGTGPALGCPGLKPSLPIGGGYIYGGIGEVTATDPHSTPIEHYTFSRAIRLFAIEEPSKYWLLADSWSTQHQNQLYIINPAASSVWRIQMRHSKRANVLFADGHIEAMDLAAMRKLTINPLVNAYNAEGQPIK